MLKCTEGYFKKHSPNVPIVCLDFLNHFLKLGFSSIIVYVEPSGPLTLSQRQSKYSQILTRYYVLTT